MGSTLASEARLMFYPTDYKESLRIIGILSYFHTSYSIPPIRDLLGMELESEIIGRYGNYNYSEVLFDKLVDNGKFNKEYFNINLCNYAHDGEKVVIADLFCGEGEWLATFKNICTANSSNSFYLVGNELEENRYKIAKKKLNTCGNMSFEELDLPENFIGLYLFNPPYGGAGSDRNARKYLEMTLKRNYILEDGVIVSILNVKDTIDCMDLFCENFDIKFLYKVNREEFEKFHQMVLIGVRKKNKNNYISQAENAERITQLNMNPDHYRFDIKYYKTTKFYIPGANIGVVKSLHSIRKNEAKLISNPNSKLWAWIKDKTKQVDKGVDKITMPLYPKKSELANVIASGYINGEFEGDVPHIVIGGTKINETTTTEIREVNGESETITRTVKASVPYLNILYTENSKICIKELIDNE